MIIDKKYEGRSRNSLGWGTHNACLERKHLHYTGKYMCSSPKIQQPVRSIERRISKPYEHLRDSIEKKISALLR